MARAKEPVGTSSGKHYDNQMTRLILRAGSEDWGGRDCGGMVVSWGIIQRPARKAISRSIIRTAKNISQKKRFHH